MRSPELRRGGCIHDRDDVPDTAATGAAVPGLFWNRAGIILREHTMEFPQDHINVVKLSRERITNPFSSGLMFFLIPGALGPGEIVPYGWYKDRVR